MGEEQLQMQIEAAQGYENLLVPALFAQWTDFVLDAAQIRTGYRVLDVACGTGVLARKAAEHVGSSGFVAGVDPDPGMLAVAERLKPTIEWRQGLAESLPYPDGSFDAVVSQFGLMFFSDRHKALEEMVRVLASGARITLAVWDAIENISAYASEVELLNRLAGANAANAVRAPFVLGEKKELMAMFEDARLASIEIMTFNGTARFPSVRTMVEADLRGWLPVMGILLDEEQIQIILTEAESDLNRYVTSRGTVEFDITAHIVTGSIP